MTDYSMIPAGTPPPGVTPNFVNPESRGRIAIIVNIISMTLMVGFVVTRFYSKYYVLHKPSWDDLTCLIAVSGAITLTGVFMAAIQKGLGRRQWDVSLSELIEGKHSIIALLAATELTYTPSLLAVKLSILLMYLNLFRPKAAFRFAVYFGIAFTSLYCTVVFTANAYLYLPRPGQAWIQAAPTPVWKIITVSRVEAGCGVFIDLYLLILPIPVVWGLQLPRAKRIGILSIFMSGSLALMASVISLYLRAYQEDGAYTTWSILSSTMFTYVELCVGIICSCMPYFAALFRQHSGLLHTIKSFLSSRLRYVSSTFHTRSNSREMAAGTQHSGSPEGRFVELEHIAHRPLPKTWPEKQEMPSASHVIQILSTSGNRDPPVENEILVKTELYQTRTSHEPLILENEHWV